MTRPRLDAERLRTLRRSHDWSVVGLARRAGVRPRTIYNAEAGRTEPRIDTLRKLAGVLGCSIADPFTKEVRQQSTGP